jgi:hypothetical protein
MKQMSSPKADYREYPKTLDRDNLWGQGTKRERFGLVRDGALSLYFHIFMVPRWRRYS